MKRIATVLILFIAVMLTGSAEGEAIFKTLSGRNGLTSSQINCIYKDSRGFMWFGTPAGLYRYDGYLFKHFQSDSQDGSSLPDSYIESIQESMPGELWIKTSAGYCIFHSESESFERDIHQVFSKLGVKEIPEIIYIDSKMNLWGYIPKTGVICYSLQQQLVYEFGYANSAYAIPEGNVCSIGECRDGAVIVYEDGSMVCCNAVRQQTTPWRNNTIAKMKLRNSKTLKVFADALDNIWLYGQGTLFCYNKQANTWDTSIGDLLGRQGISADFGVNEIAADRSGHLWLATSRYGLVKVDVNTHEMDSVDIKTMGNNQRAAHARSIQSVYVDNSNLLWVGTAKSGVAYLGNNIYKFETDSKGDITAMAKDTAGNIVYGTSDEGIVGYTGRLASLRVTALAFSGDGSLWVGSKQNGLTRIKNGAVTIYTTATDSLNSTVINDNINALCTDKSGNLWVATNGGLQVYNLRQGQFSNYTKDKLRTNTITSLFYGTENRLYVGTSEGLIILNVATIDIKHYTGNSSSMQKFTNNYITQLFEDSRGLLWVGTREGVNIFNLKSDKVDILTEKQGLCNNNICGIAEDSKHNIWISTTGGVTRIVLQRNHDDNSYDYSLYNYDSNDGLQSDEFNTGSILTLDNGNILMGGLNGVSKVKQQSDSENSGLPPVIFTQFFIGEEEIITGHRHGGRIVLPQALNEISLITLASDQNTITIRFAAGNYNQSERLQFMYWMEGLEDGWRNGDAMKHGVTFTDLPSKHYTLHVKAISVENGNSKEERQLGIIIEKPWYMQWWMLAFYVIFIIVTLFLWKKGIDQLREIWKRKNAIIAELEQQREDIKTASDDLKQPMSRMTSIIMGLAEREGTIEERDQLNSLHSQLLNLITRVSDMQSSLEHPEDKAKKAVDRNYGINSKGLLEMNDQLEEELTSEIHAPANSPTSKFKVVFIDDNDDFLHFVTARLRYVYDFHAYNDIHKAAHDIEEMIPDLVICKQDMEGMTGSELCNNIKMHPKLNKIKLVILTETKLTPNEMVSQGITLGADDYLAKPFNVQEAAMRFNKLLGVSAFDVTSNLIEGAETRMLEARNASMTTATETLPDPTANIVSQITEDEELQQLAVRSVRQRKNYLDMPVVMQQDDDSRTKDREQTDENAEMSMNDVIDNQLITNIEQYVQQNMSRGPINLEEMAGAMGMSMKPFFQKVRDVTGKTPAEVVRDLRLKHACILLQRTNINMNELANNVGFATAEHFMNMFRDRFGISPSEYRQRYRG